MCQTLSGVAPGWQDLAAGADSSSTSEINVGLACKSKTRTPDEQMGRPLRRSRPTRFFVSQDAPISRPHRDKEIIMHMTSPAPETLVGIATLAKILQRSRASIYRDIHNKTFPKSLKVGSSSRWWMSEVAAFIERLSAERLED